MCKINGLVTWNGVATNSGVVIFRWGGPMCHEGVLITPIRITHESGMNGGENPIFSTGSLS